jgi:two-component system NtrC family sensor kinase
MESVLKDVDINRLVDEAAGMREREAALMNIDFIRDYRQDLPRVHSDPSLLRQVILNLVNNAIDALPKGGQIYLQTRRSDDGPAAGIEAGTIDVVVRDTGIGIPQENLEKIFDPFFTTKEPGKGTGLGLSICHGIIQKLGGSITVDSQPGQGTTFCVQIPIEHRKGAN